MVRQANKVSHRGPVGGKSPTRGHCCALPLACHDELEGNTFQLAVTSGNALDVLLRLIILATYVIKVRGGAVAPDPKGLPENQRLDVEQVEDGQVLCLEDNALSALRGHRSVDENRRAEAPNGRRDRDLYLGPKDDMARRIDDLEKKSHPRQLRHGVPRAGGNSRKVALKGDFLPLRIVNGEHFCALIPQEAAPVVARMVIDL